MNGEEWTGQNPAWGAPGIAPRWTRASKDAVGTAYSASSRLWFTVAQGVITEVYYPTIDSPQIRDLQYLVSDGKSFFHGERRHLDSTVEALSPHSLGFRSVSSDRQGRYRIEKEIISDPHQSCLLLHTRFVPAAEYVRHLKLYVLCAPHLEVSGWQNRGQVRSLSGRKILVANRGKVWLALAASTAFSKASCGFVGATDGWTDLESNYQMDWEFDSTQEGNIALTGEIDLTRGAEFVLGLAFGSSLHSAVNRLLQALATPWQRQKERFLEQWERACSHKLDLTGSSHDGGALYHRSVGLLLSHEDKSYPGAMIASLSIPWGEVKGDDDLGGYHLVWTRDMVNSATALMAAGDMETPLRALIYLATSQRPDGGFYQNFWIDGRPYWQGVQLDEAAFPILLAWRLRLQKALREFDPYPMVLKAAGYLIRQGPVTAEERWEEASGYSPSTLAACIAGLTCAALFARQRGDAASATFIQEYADFLEEHVEAWTVTTRGTLMPGISRHYIRILPVAADAVDPLENPDTGILRIANRQPGQRYEFPAREVVDAGFLELVRYGVRKAGDALMEDSLRVVDALLKVNTPYGACWRRYNHDGYGQREDGSAFQGWGRGRAWPLLTGERGHYELAAGRPVEPFIGAMERLGNAVGLLPEQVWDEADLPSQFMFLGRPTGSAMPLMWAHAEYIRLLRSAQDGQVFDLVPEVAQRYRNGHQRRGLEVWKFNRHPASVGAGGILRVQAQAAFTLRWSMDEWGSLRDTVSRSTALEIDYVDLEIPRGQTAPVQFTFRWTEANRWEGRDFQVAVAPAAG